MPEDTPTKPLTSLQKLTYGLVGLAFLAFTGVWSWAVGAVFAPDDVDSPVFVVAESGAASLFVRESASHLNYVPEVDTVYTTRLAVYDVETGDRTARRVVSWASADGTSITPIGLAPRGVWFHDSVGGVQLVDPSDGAVLRSEGDLLTEQQRARRLRSGDLEDRVGYLEDQRGLVVTLNDGNRLLLTGEDGGPTPYTQEVPRLELPRAPGTATTFPLGGDRHGRLVRKPEDTTNSARLDLGDGPIGQLYLGAYFVQAPNRVPIQLTDPPGVYVIHASTLEDNAPASISRVQLLDGQPAWTADLGGKVRLLQALATPDLLCLVLRVDNDTVMLGLEHEDGTVRYRVELD